MKRPRCSSKRKSSCALSISNLPRSSPALPISPLPAAMRRSEDINLPSIPICARMNTDIGVLAKISRPPYPAALMRSFGITRFAIRSSARDPFEGAVTVAVISHGFAPSPELSRNVAPPAEARRKAKLIFVKVQLFPGASKADLGERNSVDAGLLEPSKPARGFREYERVALRRGLRLRLRLRFRLHARGLRYGFRCRNPDVAVFVETNGHHGIHQRDAANAIAADEQATGFEANLRRRRAHDFFVHVVADDEPLGGQDRRAGTVIVETGTPDCNLVAGRQLLFERAHDPGGRDIHRKQPGQEGHVNADDADHEDGDRSREPAGHTADLSRKYSVRRRDQAGKEIRPRLRQVFVMPLVVVATLHACTCLNSSPRAGSFLSCACAPP